MMGTGGEFELVKWLWTLLALPLAWIWGRINANEKRVQDLENKVANMPTRAEVREAVKDGMSPIKEDMRELRDFLKEHDRWEREKNTLMVEALIRLEQGIPSRRREDLKKD